MTFVSQPHVKQLDERKMLRPILCTSLVVVSFQFSYVLFPVLFCILNSPLVTDTSLPRRPFLE